MTRRNRMNKIVNKKKLPSCVKIYLEKDGFLGGIPPSVPQQ